MLKIETHIVGVYLCVLVTKGSAKLRKTSKMATHLRAVDKEFEEADDTGVLVLSGRNLRTFPTVPGELLDFADVFEAG